MRALYLVLIAQLLFLVACKVDEEEQAKTLRVLVVDKANKPYSNLYLSINDCQTRNAWAYAETDANGYFEVKNLPPDMELCLARGGSLITDTTKHYIERDEDAAEYPDSHKVTVGGYRLEKAVFKRVLYSDGVYVQNSQQCGAGNNHSVGEVPNGYLRTNTQHVAQAVRTSHDIEACGIAIGVGIGKLHAVPRWIRIFSDNGGVPGQLLEQRETETNNRPESWGGTIDTNMGLLVRPIDVCKNGGPAFRFRQGEVFWIVASFDQQLGSNLGLATCGIMPKSNLAPLQSADGVNWENAMIQRRYDGSYPQGSFQLVLFE